MAQRPQNTVNPALERIRPPRPGYVPRDIPAADLQSSVPGAFGGEQGVWIRLPGADFAPAGAVNVDESGDLVLAPGATGTLVTIVIPATFRLRIAGIGFHAGDPAALRFLTWAVQENGVSIPGYTNQVAAVGSFRRLSPEFIVRGYSATMTLVATISAASVISYTYSARMAGWLYQDMEAR